MAGSSLDKFREILSLNKKGVGKGVYSVCSAQRSVIEAAILQAREDASFAVIESTSNQVDQYGGYTGLRPEDFTRFVKSIAASLGFPEERILFGGDHLGPNVWQKESAEKAMEKAKTLVRDYVKAGYAKIHLDASMACAGDGEKILAGAVVAERTLELCRICEEAARGMKEKPLYIIGTEVPVPGGALENRKEVKPSLKEDVLETLEIHRKAFLNARLWEAWDRVIAIVAQPGVEFSDRTVSYYNRPAASDLSHGLDKSPLVFEAHSTDYQKPSGLKQLVEDHFCILKVGPWLTFRYREALFSLARIENELIPQEDDRFNDRSNLEQILENLMVRSKPNYWEKHYQGTESEKYFSRRYSLSDRCRYYWTNRDLLKAVDKLFSNLERTGIPYTLISQYMPNLVNLVSEGVISAKPNALVIANIQDTLKLYAQATGSRFQD